MNSHSNRPPPTASNCQRFALPLTLLAALAIWPGAATCDETTCPIKTVYIIEHPHLDIGYTDPPQAVEEQYKKRIDEKIAFAKEHPDFKWNIEETWQFRQWESRSSTQEIDVLVGFIRDGRFGLGGSHSTLHSSKAGIEELNRYLYDAQRLRDTYGVPIQTVYHNDSPGLPWSYPQLLARSGIKYLVVGLNLFIGGGFDAPYHPYFCRWQGPDGSSVMTWVTWTGYYETNGHYGFTRRGLDGAKLEKALQEAVKSGYPYDAIMIQCSSDNDVYRNQYRDVYEAAQKWNSEHRSPRFIMARPEDFFAHIMKRKPRIPVVKGSWDSPWDMLQMIEPQSERITKTAQDRMLSSEKAWSLASALGSSGYPQDSYKKAWDDMLVIDEHSGGDSIAKRGGATQEEVNAAGEYFEDVATKLEDTLHATTDSGIEALFSHANITEPSILVFNPLSWTRTDVVRVPVPEERTESQFVVVDTDTSRSVPAQTISVDGKRMLTFTAEGVPSIGIRRYALQPGESTPVKAAASQADSHVIENAHFRVKVAPDGSIESIRNKKDDKELVSKWAAPFGSMVRRTNAEFFYSAYGKRVDQSSDIKVSAAMTGPVCSSLVIERENSPLPRTEIVLYDDLPRIDLVETVDRNRMETATLADNSLIYSMVYPLNIAQPTCRIDTPAGWLNPMTDFVKGAAQPRRYNVQHSVQLSTERYSLAFSSPDVYTIEVPTIPAATGSTTQTVLLPVFYRKVDEVELKDKKVGQSRVEGGMPAKWQIHFSLVPRDGAFDTVKDTQTGWETCTPLQGRFVTPTNGSLSVDKPVSLLSVNSPQVILYDLKQAEFGEGLILKAQEIGGTRVSASLKARLLPVQSASQTNLLEQDLDGSLKVRKGELRLSFGPHEIKSVRLKLAPADNQ